MIRLVWVFAWLGFAVWSLIAWGAYGLVDLFGGLAASGTQSVGVLSWLVGALKSLGQGAILFVWGLVSLVILGVPWLLGRAARSGGITQVRVYQQGYPPQARSDVIDLAPDQYAVQTPPRDNDPASPETFRRFDPPPGRQSR